MKRFGLVGHPLGHSLSPAIHARIMEVAGIDGTYTLHDIAPEALAAALPVLMREFDGFNCTIPHKQTLISHLAALDVSAQACGAVNTVHRGIGYNTDTAGFFASGIVLEGRDVLLLGTGGTASMMATACVRAGARSLTVWARDPRKAAALCDAIAASAPESRMRMARWVDAMADDRFDVILNGTPVGMWPHIGGMPCETSLLCPGVVVFDPVYNPIATRLVLNARRRGATAVGGLRMLVRQAIEAQRIWNPDVAFNAAAIEHILLPELTQTLLRGFPLNILITGFMGSGKSTISRILAQRLGLAFIDLDAEIVRFAGCPIAEIFARSGERAFRLIETAVAESTLCRGNCSAVVAAGGGLPISAENRAMVRATNTLVVNIDISFEEAWRRIAADPTRPLAVDRATAEARYAARREIYADFCDFNVTTMEKPEDSAAAIALALTDIG